MANYSYISNGINFTINDDNGLTSLGGLYGNKNSTQWQKVHNNTIASKSSTIDPFVNAVEIDWNNAQLGAELIRPIGGLRCSRIVPTGYRRFAIV